MKHYVLLMTGAALVFGTAQTQAAETKMEPQAQVQAPASATAPAQTLPTPPVNLQPATPVARDAAPYSGAPTLGDSGTMYSQREAEDVANISPAAGAPDKAGIGQPSLTAPVTDKPVTAPAPAANPAAANGKTVLQDIAQTKNFSTLEKALKTSGADAALAGAGPFTVFAPSNQAFAKLPDRSFNALLRPSEKDKLAKLMNYHVVAGLHDAASIRRDIAEGGGSTTYQTVAGPNIRVTAVGNRFALTDENGNTSNIVTADAFQSNGVVHTVDTVIIPK